MKDFKENKFTIIIANYNNGKYFKDCYDSLIQQTNSEWEAIIIDDASTDDSIEIIKEIIKDDNRFKMFFNENNLGYQATVLKGIGLCNTTYFGRLDPDDALTPDAIQCCLDTFRKNTSAGLVYSNLFICDENLNIESEQKGVQVEESIFFNGEVISFAAFKKSVYLETTGIDVKNKRAEDKDIYLKMLELAPAKHIDKALYLYRIHFGSASTFDNIDRAYFWYWVAIIKAAERKKINIEDEFLKKFVRKYKYDELNNRYNKLFKNRWIKLGLKLGLIRNVK